MKILYILLCAGVATGPAVAQAGLPFDAGKLGQMKALVDVCSKATPREASKYLLQTKSLIGNATKQTVDEAAATEEYQQAYEAIRSKFSNLSQDGIVDACTSYLTTMNSR